MWFHSFRWYALAMDTSKALQNTKGHCLHPQVTRVGKIVDIGGPLMKHIITAPTTLSLLRKGIGRAFRHPITHPFMSPFTRPITHPMLHYFFPCPITFSKSFLCLATTCASVSAFSRAERSSAVFCFSAWTASWRVRTCASNSTILPFC